MLILFAVVLVLVCGASILFLDELRILGTIRKIDAPKPFYTMDVDGDYHFSEFLSAGGASSDTEVSAFLTGKISQGFYTVEVENTDFACSTLTAKTPDGMNEAGLCVADLEVNEGGMLPVDTDKPDLTVTTALRLLLNKAATVEQAVALLGQYDIHASGGISHHIAIADASSASVAVEFVEGEMVVADTPFVTNFNLANGDTAAGGENAQERFETLRTAYDANKGVFTAEQMKESLAAVSQKSEKQATQWSIVYDHAAMTATYYFGGDYDNAYAYRINT